MISPWLPKPVLTLQLSLNCNQNYSTFEPLIISASKVQFVWLTVSLFHFAFLPGTAGDALSYHRGQAFTTKDRDNDLHSSANCAVTYTGAWWYKYCYYANLNGRYLNGKKSDQGMSWYQWKNHNFSVKRSEMKIRPPNF